MRKSGGKTFILIVGVISILVIVYLIADLSTLVFKPAVPFAYRQESTTVPLQQLSPIQFPFIYFVIAIAVFAVVIFFLLPPDLRKKYLWGLARLVLIGLVLFLILSRLSMGRPLAQPTQGAGNLALTLLPEPTDTPEPEITPAEFVPPQISPWVSYSVALAFLLVIVGIWWWVMLRRKRTGAPYDALAEIARSALNDLETGKDWGDTVLQCYYRMNKAVENWRGIHRRVGMTPAEFAAYLVSASLPREAVNHLTALFERVRYGGKKSTQEDIEEAMDCLASILEFCEGER